MTCTLSPRWCVVIFPTTSSWALTFLLSTDMLFCYWHFVHLCPSSTWNATVIQYQISHYLFCVFSLLLATTSAQWHKPVSSTYLLLHISSTFPLKYALHMAPYPRATGSGILQEVENWDYFFLRALTSCAPLLLNLASILEQIFLKSMNIIISFKWSKTANGLSWYTQV